LKIAKRVTAGSLESSDVMVTLEPADSSELELMVDSIVEKQFGRRIREVATEMLEKSGLSSGIVRIQDRGALECTLRARIETAIERLAS